MPLNQQAQALREQRSRSGAPPLYTLSLARARAADLADIQAAAGVPEPVAAVEQHEIPGPGGPLPLRLYRPAPPKPEQSEPSEQLEQSERVAQSEQPDDSASDAPDRHAPALLYLFGGGWTLGSLDTADAICRRLANSAGCVVASVGYRLAPEHPFPAAVQDCAAALRHLAEHAAEHRIDPDRLAVGGDSAGGNLAAAVTLLVRAEGGPALRHQLLVYPNTDRRADTASLREHDDPYLFNRRSVDWYWGHYLAAAEDGDNPLASPLRADDLSGLPPATVLTAEFDPLRDEGEQYADRLRAAGVPVRSRRYDGVPHGFFAMTGQLDAAHEAQQFAAEQLREALR